MATNKTDDLSENMVSVPTMDADDARTKSDKPLSPTVQMIQRVTAWVLIVSAVLFAFISILAVWEVFGSNAGDVVGRALSSLFILAFAALVINVAARAFEDKL